MPKKKVIVFDLDGVLFDTIQVMADFFIKRYPTLTYQDFKDSYKENILEALQKLSQYKKEQTPEEKSKMEKDFTANKTNALSYPGIVEFLGRISLDYHLAINTSAWERNTLPLLEKYNVLQCFSYIATAETDRSKVEKFRIIAQKLSVQNSEMIFVTDTSGDVKEAAELNIPTVMVTWGLHTREDFEEELPTNLVGFADTVSDLERLINNIQ